MRSIVPHAHLQNALNALRTSTSTMENASLNAHEAFSQIKINVKNATHLAQHAKIMLALAHHAMVIYTFMITSALLVAKRDFMVKMECA